MKTQFSKETLDYFRRCWEQEQTPDIKYLNEHNLYKNKGLLTLKSKEVYDGSPTDTPAVGFRDPAFIFVQIETQFNIVERWTVFAGLWFEIIEPLFS